MIELSANPWHPSLERLETTSTDLDGDEILFNIADILDEWPGPSTSTLYLPYSKKRHDRLIKTIAGYPDIDVATRPLDWPIHRNSVRAMNTSLAIDDLSSVDPKVSLRSAILNLDMIKRKSINEENAIDGGVRDRWTILTAKCLGLLFAKTNSSRKAKEALLASLSSYDNSAGIKGLWGLSFDEERSVPECFPKEILPPNKPISPKEESGIDYDKEHPKWKIYTNNNVVYKAEHKEWEKRDEERSRLIDFPDWKWEVTFQFYRVQQWMNGLLKHDKGQGTVQRVLRGASLVLESVISEIRDIVMVKYGPGAIVIDGGGRLRVSVPSRDEAEELKKSMLIRYEGFLCHPQDTARRLGEEVRRWVDSMGINEIEFGPGKRGEYISDLIKKFALSGLPARRVHVREREENLGDQNGIDIVTALNSWGVPPEIINSDFDEKNCPFYGHESEKNKDKWGSVDNWVFKKEREMYEEYDVKVNPVHRLLYIIGHFQRMKDSVLHRPQRESMENKFHQTEIASRSVTALVKLDGNSVGHLFGMDKSEGYELDTTRRRSFRFNVHWWGAIHNAMEELEFDGGDPVGAWVVAGDDILLAEYTHAGSQETDILDLFLRNLSQQIDTGINSELRAAKDAEQQIFTFAAGYTKKAEHPDEKDKFGRSQNRIDSLMKSVGELEHSAAEHWKYQIGHVKNQSHMLSPSKKVTSEPKSTKGEFLSNGSGMNYVCKGISMSSIDKSENTLINIEWPTKWDLTSLNSIKEKIQSEGGLSNKYKALYNGDENEMWKEILTRCENRNGQTFILLKSEWISS